MNWPNLAPVAGAVGPEPGAERPSRCGRVSREFPYLAGGPARTWHLAGSTPVGCRGFIGPVPLPLLISALRLWPDATGQPGALSNAPGGMSAVRYRPATGPQRRVVASGQRDCGSRL